MAEVRVIAHCRDLLGESPVWCEQTSRLWWVDVVRPALHSVDILTNEIKTLSMPHWGRVGSIALRRQGGLVLATRHGIEMFDPATRSSKPFTGQDALSPGQCFNDGRCDRQGRFWVGSMSEDLTPNGHLYCVSADGMVAAYLDGIIVPNGIAFSPDSHVFYFADTRRFTIWAFDLDSGSGDISNQRIFAQTTGRKGRPDGSCIDSEGFLWNAEYAGGQITRYAPDGQIDRVVQLPVSHPTSLCFGGEDFDTLFVTSGSHVLSPEQAEHEPLAGAVLAFQPGVRGLPEPRFAG